MLDAKGPLKILRATNNGDGRSNQHRLIHHALHWKMRAIFLALRLGRHNNLTLFSLLVFNSFRKKKKKEKSCANTGFRSSIARSFVHSYSVATSWFYQFTLIAILCAIFHRIRATNLHVPFLLNIRRFQHLNHRYQLLILMCGVRVWHDISHQISFLLVICTEKSELGQN